MSIDSIVSFVGGKLGELLVQEAKLLYGVEAQVQSLQKELRMMNAFVIRMEAMDEEGSDACIRVTLAEIRKIAFDAEDTIESYILEANFSHNSKMENFFKRYACLCISIPHTHRVGCEIEAIKDRIAEAMDMMKKYGVDSTTSAGGSQSRGRRRRQIAYPQTSEEHVVGLEEDINKMVEVLTTDDIQVISIVGMGGSGKTTLPRKLYNQDSLKKQFDTIAWVSISEEWVVQRILLELLRQTSGETIGKDKVWSLQVLVEKLHRYLEGKRYLIVLDDVWEKRALEDIFSGLPNDGRKVIVTTRIQKVVDFPNLRCFIHEPRRLSEEESWKLFLKIAYIHKNISYLIRVDMLHKGETLEEVGQDFLDEFIQSCVVQVASKNFEGKIRSIRVHDLIRELCIKKAKEQDFLHVFSSESSNSDASGAELRRAAIYSSDKVTLPLPILCRYIRSLIYQTTSYKELDLNWKDICQNFKLLRLLILGKIRLRVSF